MNLFTRLVLWVIRPALEAYREERLRSNQADVVLMRPSRSAAPEDMDKAKGDIRRRYGGATPESGES